MRASSCPSPLPGPRLAGGLVSAQTPRPTVCGQGVALPGWLSRAGPHGGDTLVPAGRPWEGGGRGGGGLRSFRGMLPSNSGAEILEQGYSRVSSQIHVSVKHSETRSPVCHGDLALALASAGGVKMARRGFPSPLLPSPCAWCPVRPEAGVGRFRPLR